MPHAHALLGRLTHTHTSHGGGTLSGSFESPVTAVLIVRYHRGHHSQRSSGVVTFEGGFLAGQFPTCLALNRRWANPPELPRAEKAVTAGVAAVGGKSKPALQHNHGSGFHALPGNVLQVEIPTTRTVRVALEDGCHSPTVEAAVAGVASPRSQPNQAK